MSQSNTRSGSIRVLAGEDLTGKAGYLVKMTHDGGVPEVKLPDDVADKARYVVIEEAVDASLCSVAPLHGDRNVRLKLKGTCNPGDVIVPAAIDGTEDGKVQALPATADVYFGVGIAEEVGVDGQLVLVRPTGMGLVTVT